jgi:hypothetical protein
MGTPHRHELKPLGRQTPTRATTRVPSPRPLNPRPYYDDEAAPQGRGVIVRAGAVVAGSRDPSPFTRLECEALAARAALAVWIGASGCPGGGLTPRHLKLKCMG